ncbi:hypothetical protein BOX15_Mlig012066g1 [Macrostomum lignano]|uniref:Uncharacterized protein n=1 Tax=Macrostomum lignano TaxID=282301 RepID=A0A267GXA1_9PLAT|nr:hypothetical protein BOX15_Mlig012066g1 [Macrostomum lignano]
MPTTKKTHNENRQSLCLLCLRRASALISSCSNFESVAADLFQDYEAVRHFLPEGVCQGCRRVLSSLRSLTPRALPPRPDYEKIIADMKSLPPATRSRPDCNCQLCEMARGNHHKGSDPKTPYTTGPARAPPGRPRERSPAPAEGATAVLSCSYCHSPVGRGKQHKCNSTAKVTNIEQTVSPRTREMLASNCIAEKTGGSTADSNSITLARHRGGHPIRVAVHVAQNSSASFPPTRTDTMMHLKTTLNLSNNQVLQAAQVLRAGASSSRAVESNLKKILVQQNRALEDYFDIQNLQFSELTSTAATADTICRPTVVCNDSVKLIAHVAQQRSFNDFHCLLGLDGGGGFFKVCVSIIGSNAKPEIGTRGANSRKFCDTGVKKILLLAIVNDVPETYGNIQALLEAIAVNELQIPVTADMKVANIICGLQPHSCTHPCPYCEALAPLTENGVPRTLGRIRQFAQQFQAAGQVRAKAKNFKNCVNMPLLPGDDDKEVLMLLPPPELHLLLGVSNRLLDKLNEAWGANRAFEWAHQHGIIRADYRGGMMEGNACRQLLRKSPQLHADLPPPLQPYGACLMAFDRLVSSAFGTELAADFEEAIENFRLAYMSLSLPVTPKVHVVFCHVGEFCRRTGQALGSCSEQAVESVHSDFAKTWSRYSLPAHHAEFGQNLLRAVVAYNSHHI